MFEPGVNTTRMQKGLNPPEWDMLSSLRLQPLDLQVYTYAVDCRRFDEQGVAEELGIDAETARESVLRLLTLGLLRPSPCKEGGYAAAGPESARMLSLYPLENELRRRAEAVGLIRRDLETLSPIYQDSSAWKRRSGAFEVLDDVASVRSLLAKEAAECREEVLAAQPGGGRRVEVLAEAIERDEDMLRRGVRMRTLYQHTALFDGPAEAYAERLTGLGGEVRTTSVDFMRLIIFDRKLAIISYAEDPEGAVVIREPSTVRFAVAAFDLIWLNAEPVEAASGREKMRSVSKDLDQAILRLLAEGMDDRGIARKLGMSLRTSQRRVSRIIETLGARSRFEAGYLIGSGGLLDDASAREVQAPRTAGEQRMSHSR
ncbi:MULTISPECIES: helix-turn-helix transcriptional regulator [Streptomyces]|nr:MULTISPECIES: helix-turn-helix transcriptional regulator [Streptomyces]